MTQESLVTRLKRRILCEWLNHHKGKPSRHGEYMYLWCRRCETLNHPVKRPSPEELRERYREAWDGER